MNRVLVIGGSGNVGRHVLSQLSAKGAQVRALTRKPDASRLPPQIPLVRGDPALPETLDSCLQNIDTVFLLWTAPATAVAPAVQRIAKHAGASLSFPSRTKHRTRSSNSPIRPRQIERLIENSGLQWTFLRPGMFAATFCAGGPRRFVPAMSCAGPIFRPTAPIDERDIARVAVHALCDDGPAGADYVLTGPDSLTGFEPISIIGRVIGRTLRIEEISPDEARQELLSIMPAGVVNMSLNAWAAAIGQPAFVTSTVADITGVPARPFATGWRTTGRISRLI